MARGRKTSLTIHLTPAERRTLLVWQRATTIPAGLARRGRIILLLADGVPITAIAATVGISRALSTSGRGGFWSRASRDWPTNPAVAPDAGSDRITGEMNPPT